MRQIAGAATLLLLGACAPDRDVVTAPQQSAAAPAVGPVATPEQRANDEKWHISERPDFRTAERIPEFAGAHYDSSGSGVFVIRVTSLEQAAEAANTFLSEHDAMITSMGGRALRRPSKIEGRLADYSFRQLADWRALMWTRFPAAVHIIDVNEATNRLELGLSDMSAESELRATMEGLGIPRGAVVIQPAGDNITTSCPGNLLDWLCRPITGGTLASSHGDGTLGPVGRDLHSFQPYVLINGHFAGIPNQFNAADTVANVLKIGHEVFDRGGVTCGKLVNLPCRHADVAVYTIDNWADFVAGRVARTNYWTSGWGTPGSTTINSTTPYFNYMGWTSALMYYPTQKVGRITGWTRGTNVSRCTDTLMPGFAIWLTCQDRGTYYLDIGDSGSPVSAWDDPNNIYYTGIHWGRHQYLGNYSAWYSPMTQVIGEYATGGMAIVF
jgi:hypothetical protein